MIYIESTTEEQRIALPVPYGYEEGGDDVRLFILSTVDLKAFEVNRATEGGAFAFSSYSEAFRIGLPKDVTLTADGRYLILPVKFNNAPVVGSWEYRLIQGAKVLGGGCCQVGDYEPQVTQYDKPIQYEQY